MFSIFDNKTARIKESMLGKGERHLMLPLILSVFCFIPLKLRFLHYDYLSIIW
jgi:hypothetical protein